MPLKNIRLRLGAAILWLLPLFLLPAAPRARGAEAVSRYDVLYVWDKDLNNLQDYKEELERQLGAEVGKKLHLIQSGDRYGIIYDLDDTPLSAAKTAVRHSALLGRVGLGDARAIKDEGYHELYNVSYGKGPNLEILAGRYRDIYRCLGAEIGKDLFIEKSGDGKFTLIYRKQGERQATMALARRHAEQLAKLGIPASITREQNNEVVFGEASLLDHEEKDIPAPAALIAAKPGKGTPREPASATIPVLTVTGKKCVIQRTASGETPLAKEIEKYLGELRSTGQVAKDEKTGWLVIDLTKGETIVDINVDTPYQAASMIKPLVALAYFHRLKKREVVYGAEVRRDMEAMIQRSCNDATNRVLKRVGGPRAAQEILSRYYGHILHETSIVEYIPDGGRTYRNKASVKDYGRFLVALWEKELPHSEEIRRLMALPGRDRLYCGTQIPQGTLVYNKTGTTAKLCGDMGILVPKARNGKRYPYVLVGVIEKQNKADNYGSWQMARGNVIRKISSMVYQGMKASYNLL